MRSRRHRATLVAEHAAVGPRAPAPTGAGQARAGARRRVAVGAAALALPLLGLVVLRLSGQLDRLWQHESTHFWIVLGAALLSAVTAYGTGAAAVRRGDVRVMYVSQAFLSAARCIVGHKRTSRRKRIDHGMPPIDDR